MRHRLSARRRELAMKIREMLNTIIRSSGSHGTYSTSNLIRQAKTDTVTGLATAVTDDRELYLAFVSGEVEGAIIIDDAGELYGDKAVMLITGKEQFTLYDVDKEIIDAVVMGCRVFTRSHLRATSASDLPEFGTKSSGMGNLTVIVRHMDAPLTGIRVSIRKDGKIVGSDQTVQDGSVGFRVMHGPYDCVLQDRSGAVTTRRISFDEPGQTIVLEL